MNEEVKIKSSETTLETIGAKTVDNLQRIAKINNKIREKIASLDGEKPRNNPESKQDIAYGYINQVNQAASFTSENIDELEQLLDELFKLV